MIALTINQGGSEVGIPMCSQSTRFPIIQDNSANNMRSVLGSSNALIIVDGSGTLIHRIAPASFPDAAQVIESFVDPLIE